MVFAVGVARGQARLLRHLRPGHPPDGRQVDAVRLAGQTEESALRRLRVVANDDPVPGVFQRLVARDSGNETDRSHGVGQDLVGAHRPEHVVQRTVGVPDAVAAGRHEARIVTGQPIDLFEEALHHRQGHPFLPGVEIFGRQPAGPGDALEFGPAMDVLDPARWGPQDSDGEHLWSRCRAGQGDDVRLLGALWCAPAHRLGESTQVFLRIGGSHGDFSSAVCRHPPPSPHGPKRSFRASPGTGHVDWGGVNSRRRTRATPS